MELKAPIKDLEKKYWKLNDLETLKYKEAKFPCCLETRISTSTISTC